MPEDFEMSRLTASCIGVYEKLYLLEALDAAIRERKIRLTDLEYFTEVTSKEVAVETAPTRDVSIWGALQEKERLIIKDLENLRMTLALLPYCRPFLEAEKAMARTFAWKP